MIHAGMHAVRENRYVVLPKDFGKGYKNKHVAWGLSYRWAGNINF